MVLRHINLHLVALVLNHTLAAVLCRPLTEDQLFHLVLQLCIYRLLVLDLFLVQLNFLALNL